MTKSIKLMVKEITYTNGKTDIEVLTPKEWAGRLRRKGYKKTILVKKELATLNINIKTKN